MKLNWGFWIAVAYIVFAGSMIAFAVIAGNQKYDLVTENYYDEAVAYQGRIDAVRNAKQSGTDLRLSYDQSSISIRIERKSTASLIQGEIYFYKPDNAGSDFHVPFDMRKDQEVFLLNRKLNHGLWNITVQWNNDSLACIIEEKLFVQ